MRIGTAEIYGAVESLPQIAEALAVGQDWQGDVRVVLFVRLQAGVELDDALRREIRAAIRSQTSARHVPAKIVAVADIPRTRSGKLTELAVRNVIHGLPVKNLDALANPRSSRALPRLCPILRPDGGRVSDAPDLCHRYASQLAGRGFASDAAQLAAVAKLESLRRRLIGARRSRLPGWLGAPLRRRPQAPVQGLYLWGGVGRGKTWLMDLFFASLPFPQARRQHFHRFMHDVHARLAQLTAVRDPLERVAADIARDTRVLCFDELQVSDIADAMILGALFAGLFARGVTLVATSNTPPRELYKDGLQRQRFLPAILLLERNLEVIRVDGATDYRLRQLTQAGTYLAADCPDTPARLAALFASLAAHGTRAGGEILIEGRRIPVVCEAAGVVWFDFTALCAGPRSANDYIEIAREYQSVIVSNVPLLDEAMDDEARRFIALVDEFYDRNVNLIVSAAAPATGLYRGERLRAPFERTVSRLIEMRSAEYLAREHKP